MHESPLTDRAIRLDVVDLLDRDDESLRRLAVSGLDRLSSWSGTDRACRFDCLGAVDAVDRGLSEMRLAPRDDIGSRVASSCVA